MHTIREDGHVREMAAALRARARDLELEVARLRHLVHELARTPLDLPEGVYLVTDDGNWLGYRGRRAAEADAWAEAAEGREAVVVEICAQTGGSLADGRTPRIPSTQAQRAALDGLLCLQPCG